MSDIVQCEDCVFAVGIAGSPDVVECRRLAPRVRSAVDEGGWPWVPIASGCGEGRREEGSARTATPGTLPWLRLAFENGPASVPEILAVSSDDARLSTVTYHLKQLAKSGLVAHVSGDLWDWTERAQELVG